MAVAARVNPKDFFEPRGMGAAGRAFVLEGPGPGRPRLGGDRRGDRHGALVWPITIPLAVMIIGARQLGLAILMHDAAHGALHPDPKVNDWVGEWLCGGGVVGYRNYHLQHHKYAQQAEDPDLVLSAPFPITPPVAAAQDRPRPDRPDLVQAAVRAADRKAEGAQTGRAVAADPGRRKSVRQRRWLIVNGLAIVGFARCGLLVGLVRALAAAARHLVPAGHPPAQHRRARPASPRTSPTRCATPAPRMPICSSGR